MLLCIWMSDCVVPININNYTVHHQDMVYVPANCKVSRKFSNAFSNYSTKNYKHYGRTGGGGGGVFNISRPSARDNKRYSTISTVY